MVQLVSTCMFQEWRIYFLWLVLTYYSMTFFNTWVFHHFFDMLNYDYFDILYFDFFITCYNLFDILTLGSITSPAWVFLCGVCMFYAFSTYNTMTFFTCYTMTILTYYTLTFLSLFSTHHTITSLFWHTIPVQSGETSFECTNVYWHVHNNRDIIEFPSWLHHI